MFDAHFHIIDSRFPLVPNAGYLPDGFDIAAYRGATASLNVSGGAVVSGSFQAFDQSYLEDALPKLGPDFVGVTQLPATVTDEEILRLHGIGVRAVRFNLRRGGSAGVDALDSLGKRVHEVAGWHVELYIDARELPSLATTLDSLPRVGIDHLGLSREGLPHLRTLVEKGGFVKATGFGRLDFAPAEALAQLVSINPDAVVFGTDLPSTRAPRAFAPNDIELVRDTLTDTESERVLDTNARRIYLDRSRG